MLVDSKKRVRDALSSLRDSYQTNMATAKKVIKKKAAAAKKTVKKSTKKTPANSKNLKGQAARKTTSKKTEGRVLVCADGETCFWTNDGRILKDLTELRDALAGMAEEVYKHHVTKDKNDFAEHVHGKYMEWQKRYLE